MARYRMSLAEASLGEALKIDPKAASAVVGMGELLYREGRFTDALARFEAGIQADPEGTVAKIGVAKTKIAFDRLQEAKDLLKKLRDARPDDVLPAYWLARAEEALGDKAVAEKLYEQAIKAGKGDEDVVDSYIALAQLMVSQGRAADAEAKLADARKELPDTVRIHKALGEAHLQAGRLEVAQAEFDAALKMDAEDLPARFNLGVTFRRMHRFEDAAAEFDKVSVSDKDYPGLALERGLLYEASNRTEEALAYYQQALAKAPGDLDLMLRVGSAEVMSGHAAQAEDILRKVIAKRVNSADVNHYLGRALLLKGTNLVEALRYLKRAVDLDANRAEYHLYVGWAANEAGQPAVAKEELDKAIDLDKGLADAYWQRGVLLRKQGAVVDAIRNLYKALELRPSRFEAYATLAECLEDQNKTMDAIVAWRKAISVDGKRAEWHYRLGRLMGHGGLLELEQAVSLGEAQTIKPGWLSQAYFELAEAERAGGKRQEAINHYRLFLASAKNDSPYRTDAMRALDSLGVRNEL
jgi:tetratricopeptide (TPR) repeat protein